MMNKGVLGATLVVVLFLATACNAQKIGVKATVSSNGLNYLKDVGMNILAGQLSTVTVPDQSGSAETPIGHIEYTLSNIVMRGLQIPSTTITLVPPSNVDLAVSGAQASMTMDWRYKEKSWPHTSDHGSASIKVSGVSITIGLTVGASDGRATAVTSVCKVNIGNLDITLHGGASWLYNIFVSAFSGQIKSSTSNQLQNQLPPSINHGLASALSSLPITQPINSKIYLNYQLQADPRVQVSAFTLDTLGEFYSTHNPQETPSSPAALPDVVNGEMAQIFVSDFTVNSASFVLFQNGQMSQVITDSMLPPDAPLRLNTTYFTELIPPLQKAFPDKMFDLVVYAMEAPDIQFSPNGAMVSALGGINFVILPEKDVAFTLGVKMLASGAASMDGLNVTGKLTFLNASISLYNTTIGQFDVSVLQGIVDTLITQAVIPMGNNLLKAGFPLPTVNGLTFVSPTVGWGNNFLYVSTDIQYSPSVGAEDVTTPIAITVV